MSALTKVMVVFVVVLSVLLVALVIPFVANTENYKQDLVTAEKRADVAEELAKLQASEVQAAQEKVSILITNLEADKQGLRRELSTAQEQLRNERSVLQSQRSEVSKLQADASQDSAALKQMTQILDTLQSELARRRTEMLDNQTRSIQLADRNNELESQIETYERQIRRFKEQMTELQEDRIALERKLQQVPSDILQQIEGESGSTTTDYELTQRVAGSITGIESFGGDTFVMIDVGANDQVTPNVSFLIHRGDDFLGRMVVTTVDANESAGRVMLLQGDIQVGDSVLTGGY